MAIDMATDMARDMARDAVPRDCYRHRLAWVRGS
jgi:hypothetical protein